MKKLAVLGVPLLALFVLGPMLVAVLLVTLTQQAASCVRHTGQNVGAASGDVRVAQANLKTGRSLARFNADLTRTLAGRPDLVSLNEVHDRTRLQLERPGYTVFRDPAATGQARSTAVGWRSERWARVDAGRVVIVARGPQQWDAGRSATWVTLRRTGSAGAGVGARTVSLVSVHHMINPANFGADKPRRRRLYRRGMAKVADLVTTLSVAGPVFVAGDFNSQWSADDPWGPRRMLGPESWGGQLASPHQSTSMRTSMDALGQRRTHDGGGTIDYVFYQPARARPTDQKTVNLGSDHDLLSVDFTLGATETPPSSEPGAQTQAAPTSAGPEAGGLGLSPGQWKRAAQVVAVGKAMGISGQGIVVALAVVSQESGFRVYANDGHGADLAADQQGIARSLRLPHDAVGSDHGSLGVFQQQWPWWGSMQQLMDPAASARRFYRALLEVPGWQRLPLTVAAQEVQVSAYPDAYADDEALARQIYARLADISPSAVQAMLATSTEDAGCATELVASGAMTRTGAVVLPLPAHLAGTDRHNWGGSGSRWRSWHTGTDFSTTCGTPVLATHAGTVQIDTTQDWSGRWLVKVTQGRGGPGRLSTWYAHMQKVLVADGQTVSPGEQLGEVGSEGNSTGCHLHFEVHTKNGSIYGPDNTDPTTWLAQHLSGRKEPACRLAIAASTRAIGRQSCSCSANDAATPTPGPGRSRSPSQC